MAQSNDKITLKVDLDDDAFMNGLALLKSTATDVMGSLTDVLNSSENAVSALGSSFIDVNKNIIGFMESSVEGSSTLTKSLEGINGALSVFDFASTGVAPMVQAFQEAQLQLQLFKLANTETALSEAALNGTLSIGQVVVGVLTGQIGLATAATSLWNAACTALGGPFGVVLVGIGALVAGIAAFCSASDEESAKMEEVNAHIQEQVDSWNELKTKKEEMIVGDLAELDHTKALATELMNLVDVNGKVKAGSEDRAKFILDSMNSALGTEYDMTQGVIQGYDELSQSIDNLIAKERAQIILEAEKEQYTEAIKERTHALTELSEREAELNEAKASNNEAEIAEKQAVYDSQLAIVKNYNNAIAQYEADAVAIKTGNIEAMNAMNDRYSNSYVENGEVVKLSLSERLASEQNNLQSLQELRDEAMLITNESEKKFKLESLNAQIAASQASMDQMVASNQEGLSQYDGFIQEKLGKANELQEGLKNNEKGVTKQQVEEAQKQVISGLVSYGDYVNQKLSKANELKMKLANNEEGVTQDMVNEAEDQAQKALTGFGKVSTNINDAMKNLPQDTQKIFKNMTAPMYAEMEAAKSGLYEKAVNIGSSIVGAFKGFFQIQSPSRKTREIFKNVLLGAEKGFAEEKENLLNQTKSISNDVIDNITSPTSAIEKMFKNLDLSAVNDMVKLAILSEQLRMSAVVQTQSKIEMLKMNVLKAETQSIQGKLDAVIENHVDLDGRELAVALAPMISEELAFNWR